MSAEPLLGRRSGFTRRLIWAMLALPWFASAQEIDGGLEPSAPPLAAEAAPSSAESERPRTHTWRDRFAPFQDPVGTEPGRLRQPMALSLPPDLLTGAVDAPQEPAFAGRAIEGSCATRAAAAHPDNPQWALQTLRNGQVPATPSGAGAHSMPLLTLPAAVQLALCHNPQVRASWSAIAQQAAQVGQAQSAYWPQLNAGIGRQRSRLSYSHSEAGARSTYATTQNAALTWRLWDFGARGARTNAAQAQLQAALHSQDATVRKALAEVLHAYGEAQAAQARLRTQRTLLPLAERSVQAAQRRQQGGAGSGNDTLQAIAAQARIQLEQSRSQGEMDKTTVQLAYLLGLPPDTAFRLEAIESPATPAFKPSSDPSRNAAHPLLARSLDAWLEHGRKSHPAIQAAKAQWDAARANLKAVQSEGLPTLDFSLAHYRNGRPNTAITDSRSRENVVGITLNIPIFDGFNTTYKVRAAQALVEQKAIEYQSTEQQTLQELAQLHAEAKATLNNLRMANSLYAVAYEAADSIQRQYDKGAVDIVQLNQNLSSLQQAQLELAQSQAQWNRAKLRLWLQASWTTINE